jgi:cytochrome c2
MKHTLYLSTLILALAFTACGKKQETATTDTSSASKTTADTSAKSAASSDSKPAEIAGAALAGQKIFYNTAYGKIKNACSSCHTDGQPTTKDPRIRPGHTLVGITSRTSTWNGQFSGDNLAKNAYGATLCAVMYQHKGDNLATVMPKADIDALNAYYTAIKGNPDGITTNLKIQWVTKPAVHEEDKIDEKAAGAAAKAIIKLPGDPNNGKELFTRTCQYCHSMKEKKVGPSLKDAMKDAMTAAKAVRCGSDAMPFYGKDLLSDQQIADIIAFIQQELGK